MRIELSIGNPETEEWESYEDIVLIPYSEVFAKEYPGLPMPASFSSEQLSVKDYEIDIHGQSAIHIEAHYDVRSNSINLYAKHNGKSFAQVQGQATNEHGIGLSLIVSAPSTDIPVELRCKP